VRCHRCHRCQVSRVSQASRVSVVTGFTGVTGVTGVRCHGFHGCHRCHGCRVSRVSRVSGVMGVGCHGCHRCHGCHGCRVSQVSRVSGVMGVGCHGCHGCHGCWVSQVSGVTGVRCHGCQVSSVLCSPTLVSPAVIMEERLSPAPHTPVTAGAWRAGDIATQQPPPLGQEVKGGSGASSPTSPRRTHGVRSPRRVTSPQDRSPQRTGHPSVLIEHGDVSVRSWVTGGDTGDTLSPALTDGVHGGGLCVSHSSQRWTRDTQWPPLGFHLEIVTAVTPGL
jgi:hypothetical protein